jgi:hypothetical protein
MSPLPPTKKQTPETYAKPAAPAPRLLPLLGELIPRGDGTFILRPKITEADLDTWLTIRQAGEILGHVKTKTIYSLLGEYLVFRRPLRHKTLISLRSVLALKQATQDAEFWDNRILRQRIKDQVRANMEKLATEALGPIDNQSLARPSKQIGLNRGRSSQIDPEK